MLLLLCNFESLPDHPSTSSPTLYEASESDLSFIIGQGEWTSNNRLGNRQVAQVQDNVLVSARRRRPHA